MPEWKVLPNPAVVRDYWIRFYVGDPGGIIYNEDVRAYDAADAVAIWKARHESRSGSLSGLRIEDVCCEKPDGWKADLPLEGA